MDNHTIHKIEENHIYKQCSKCEKNLSINNYHKCKGGKYGNIPFVRCPAVTEKLIIYYLMILGVVQNVISEKELLIFI